MKTESIARLMTVIVVISMLLYIWASLYTQNRKQIEETRVSMTEVALAILNDPGLDLWEIYTADHDICDAWGRNIQYRVYFSSNGDVTVKTISKGSDGTYMTADDIIQTNRDYRPRSVHIRIEEKA